MKTQPGIRVHHREWCLFLVLSGLLLALGTSRAQAQEDKNLLTDPASTIREQGVEKLVNLAEKKDGYATYSLGLLPDEKTYRAFIEFAAVTVFKKPKEIDWDTHAIVVVVLKENSKAVHFKKWTDPKDGVAELLVQYYGSDRGLTDSFPAQLYRVEKKGLKKVVVKLKSWLNDEIKPLGEIDLAVKPPPAEYVRKAALVEAKGTLVVHPRDQKPVITLDDGEWINMLLKIGDKQYPLAFEKNGLTRRGRMASLYREYVGVVKGRLETRRSDGKDLEIIVVSDLQVEEKESFQKTDAVEVKGKVTFEDLEKAKGKEFRWLWGTISAEGKTFYLSYGYGGTRPKEFDELVAKFNGKTAVVAGTVRKHPDVKEQVIFIKTVKPADEK